MFEDSQGHRQAMGFGGSLPIEPTNKLAPKRFTQTEVAGVFVTVFDEVKKLRAAGQAEYAGGIATPFGNFERLAGLLKVVREKVLLVYMMKHIDGIFSYVNGHKSQRESVKGRINDAITYLILLRAMIEEQDG